MNFNIHATSDEPINSAKFIRGLMDLIKTMDPSASDDAISIIDNSEYEEDTEPVQQQETMPLDNFIFFDRLLVSGGIPSHNIKEHHQCNLMKNLLRSIFKYNPDARIVIINLNREYDFREFELKSLIINSSQEAVQKLDSLGLTDNIETFVIIDSIPDMLFDFPDEASSIIERFVRLSNQNTSFHLFMCTGNYPATSVGETVRDMFGTRILFRTEGKEGREQSEWMIENINGNSLSAKGSFFLWNHGILSRYNV
jgi:hypothetical protein